MEILINAVLIILGLGMLCFGGNWLVSGGVGIAKKFGVSQMVIGLTIVAYGTSTPELAASIAAAGSHTELILGNVVGSNIANIGMVIGISAFILPLVVSKSLLRMEIPILIGTALLLIGISLDGEISQLEGVFLIGGLVAFTAFTFKLVKKDHTRSISDGTIVTQSHNAMLRSVGFLAIGITLLYFGASLTVDNAVAVAQYFSVPERIIGITIIAIGTSLPELITSVVAIRKGHTNIGIGNIIGSNIYNILMIIGVSATLGGITVVSDIYVDYFVMIAFSVALFVVMKTGLITKKMGIGLVVAFSVYLSLTLLL